MNLDAVMEEIGDRLDTIDGLRVYRYPSDRPTPPAAIVGYPVITYDETYRRGMDRYDLPVWVIVGLASDRAAKKVIAPYVAGAGSQSVKTALDTNSYESLDTLRVGGVEPDPVNVDGVDYLAYRFNLDIAGKGAA